MDVTTAILVAAVAIIALVIVLQFRPKRRRLAGKSDWIDANQGGAGTDPDFGGGDGGGD